MNAAILQDKEGGRHLSASCLLLLHASLNAGWEQRICTAKTLISDLATKALARSDEINRKALPRVGYSHRFIHGHANQAKLNMAKPRYWRQLPKHTHDIRTARWCCQPWLGIMVVGVVRASQNLHMHLLCAFLVHDVPHADTLNTLSGSVCSAQTR